MRKTRTAGGVNAEVDKKSAGRPRQSVLDDFFEVQEKNIEIQALSKRIRFWDFARVSNDAYAFLAAMLLSLRNVRGEFRKAYREYYTSVYIQTPDEYTIHNEEIMEMEYLITTSKLFAIIVDHALSIYDRERPHARITGKWTRNIVRAMDEIKSMHQRVFQEVTERHEGVGKGKQKRDNNRVHEYLVP